MTVRLSVIRKRAAHAVLGSGCYGGVHTLSMLPLDYKDLKWKSLRFYSGLPGHREQAEKWLPLVIELEAELAKLEDDGMIRCFPWVLKKIEHEGGEYYLGSASRDSEDVSVMLYPCDSIEVDC